MRVYAYARGRIGESFFHKLIFSYSFLSSFVEGKKNKPLFSLKRAVVFIKTSRRFQQNEPSFSSKQAVVFIKTSRCFATEKQTMRQDVRESLAKNGFGTDVAIILAIIVIHHQ